MIKNIHSHNGANPLPLHYVSVSECPICHVTLEPTILHEIVTTNEESKEAMLSVLAFCRKCRNTFLSTYSVIKEEALYREKRFFDTRLIQSVPLIPVSQKFSERISQLSPKFVDIYNQSYQAEQLGLSDICGMGYRKALEFLIKDYLIFKNPNTQEQIENKPLSQCVTDLGLINDSMQIVAKAAVWLGNDETHFTRKHMEYNTDDLKRFIQATTSFIDLMFAVEDAASIQSQK